MQRALNYDLTPALSVPLRFFLSALIFALLASLLLLWAGPQALSSRWTPAVLAMTHLWLLGCFTLTIIGALFQLFPVVGGHSLPGGNLYANTILACISAGALLLALAFLSGTRQLFPVAAVTAGGGLTLFLLGCLHALASPRPPLPEGAKPMFRTLALALCFLSFALLSGVVNAMLRSGSLATHQWLSSIAWLAPGALTDAHAVLGLLGWIAMMIMAVAPQVIPMFQATEPYPYRSEWRLPILFALVLLSWLLCALLPAFSWIRQTAVAAILLACLAFALLTLKTLKTRKRAEPDGTTGFWQAAMAFLILACFSWMAADTPLLAGVLLAGAAFSAINGMLYQIVPFLIWLHAHHQAKQRRPIMPKMRDIIPLRQARRQCGLHIAALALLAGATLYPAYLARPAALAMLASVLWLCANLWRALRIYRAALQSLQ